MRTIYVVRNGKLVQVDHLEKRQKLRTADRAEVKRQDGIMAIPEAQHYAKERIKIMDRDGFEHPKFGNIK